MVVLHYAGYPCDMAAIDEVAERHGLVVVEDAAHAPGASLSGRMCGTLGRVGCFSFFANKNLPVGEGGMIVTDDEELAARLRLLRSHGMTTLTWDRHRGHASTYDVVLPGFNYRLDEVRAAIGLVQLRRLPEENAGRARIAARYREALDGAAGPDDAVRRRRGEARALAPPGGRAAARGRRSRSGAQPPSTSAESRRASTTRRSTPSAPTAPSREQAAAADRRGRGAPAHAAALRRE